MLIVALGTIMVAMDFGIATMSFPVLTKVFQTDLARVMWVTLSYSLVNVCLMLLMGKISDIIGRKKVYIVGLAIFTIGMLLCAVAQSIGHLIFYRACQAVGASMIITSGPAIIAEAFPPKELGKGLGFIQASVSFGFIIGPVLGGLLLNWFDWRSIFYTRVPIILFVLVFSLYQLKKDSPLKKEKVQFDIKGTFTSSAGLFFIIFGVSQVSQVGIYSSLVHISVSLGILIFAVFIFLETRVKDPIVDLSLFKIRVFSYSILALFFTFVALPVYVLLMPFYLMDGIGLTPSEAGILLAVTSVLSAVSSPISGSLSDRYGAVWFAIIGAFFTLVSFSLIYRFNLDTTIFSIVPALALLGVSSGTFQTTNNSTLMGAVPKKRFDNRKP